MAACRVFGPVFVLLFGTDVSGWTGVSQGGKMGINRGDAEGGWGTMLAGLVSFRKCSFQTRAPQASRTAVTAQPN